MLYLYVHMYHAYVPYIADQRAWSPWKLLPFAVRAPVIPLTAESLSVDSGQGAQRHRAGHQLDAQVARAHAVDVEVAGLLAHDDVRRPHGGARHGDDAGALSRLDGPVDGAERDSRLGHGDAADDGAATDGEPSTAALDGEARGEGAPSRRRPGCRAQRLCRPLCRR